VEPSLALLDRAGTTQLQQLGSAGDMEGGRGASEQARYSYPRRSSTGEPLAGGRPDLVRSKSARHLSFTSRSSGPPHQSMSRMGQGGARVEAPDLSQAAAPLWWEDFGHRVELEPSNKMVEMPEWLGKVKLWGGWQQPQMLQESMQSVEDLESQEGDTAAPTVPQEDTEPPMTDEPPSPPLPTRVSPPPPPPHNAAHGATVAVMSRPNVMSLKTVSTTLPWGEECRVMSELYAVLVTGVPKIQQQRDLLRAREEKERSSPFKWHTGARPPQQQGTPVQPEPGSPPRQDTPFPAAVTPPATEGPAARQTCPAIVQHLNSNDPSTPTTTNGHLGHVDSSPSMYRLPEEHPCSDVRLKSNRSTHTFGSNSLKRTRKAPRRKASREHLTDAANGDAILDIGSIELREMRFSALVEADEEASCETTPSPMMPRQLSLPQSSIRGDDFLSQNDVVAAVFQQLFPHTFFCVVPIHKDTKVESLLFKWESLSRKLEVVKRKEELWGRRPLVRVGGFGCCGGRLVDAKEHCMQKVAAVEEAIKAARAQALASDPAQSCFVLFTDQFSATVAAQSVIHPEDGHMFQTQPAPGPDEIHWMGLWSTQRERFIRCIFAWPFLLFFILFPVGFFSASVRQVNAAICNSGNRAFRGYCSGSETDSVNLYNLVTSPLIPSLLLSLWQTVVMPHALYFLSLIQADCPSQSHLDRKIGRYFMLWGILNLFLGGMLGGMVQVVSIINNPADALHVVGESAVAASNFFIQLVQVQSMIIAPLGMLHPHMGVWIHLVARLLHKRAGGCCLLDRDVAKTWTAKSYRYGKEIPIHLTIFMLGVAYSAAQPAILPYCLMYFCLFWIVRRYQTIYVFERCYESGGLFWPLAFQAILYMLLLFQVFMSAVLIFFGASVQASVLFFTIPLGLYHFRSYCHRRFDIATVYLPLELGDRAPAAMVEPALFVSPPLRNGAGGWHPEVRKAWANYGMVAGVRL